MALDTGLCGLVGELVVAAEDALVRRRFEVCTLVCARQTVELGLAGALCARVVAILTDLCFWVTELCGCARDALHRRNLEELDARATRQTRRRGAGVARQTAGITRRALLSGGVAPLAVYALYALRVCIRHLEVGRVAARLALFGGGPATCAAVCVAFHAYLLGLVTEFAELAWRARRHQRVEVRNHHVTRQATGLSVPVTCHTSWVARDAVLGYWVWEGPGCAPLAVFVRLRKPARVVAGRAVVHCAPGARHARRVARLADLFHGVAVHSGGGNS